MAKAIYEGRFREDLFYRLNSVPVHIPPLRIRGNDIALLFRKFANDFAEKYRMPAVRLTEDAMQVLINYSWPGNVRQLKNITEQISILEQNREINKEKLVGYLPDLSVGYLPVPVGGDGSSEKSFNSEREILYQVLFDMRKDMNDLKKLVHDIIGKEDNTVSDITHLNDPYTRQDISPTIVSSPVSPIKMKRGDIQDTEEYVEESFSLEEVEKEMIKKALERHGNKRKYAAQDLKISERTLYRKIKEYGLE
jgi:DNA-binding NtrC family response regulator